MSKKNVASVGFSGFIAKNALDALNAVLRADHKRAVLDSKRSVVKDSDPLEYTYTDGYNAVKWALESEDVDNEFKTALARFRKCASYERTEIVFGDERKVNVCAFDALDIECKNGGISAMTVVPVVISMGLAGRISTVKDKDYAKAVQVANDLARRVNARLEAVDHKGKAYKSTSKGIKANVMIRKGRIKDMSIVFYAEIVTFYRALAEETKGKACLFENDGSLTLKESNVIDPSKDAKGGITKAKK